MEQGTSPPSFLPPKGNALFCWFCVLLLANDQLKSKSWKIKVKNIPGVGINYFDLSCSIGLEFRIYNKNSIVVQYSTMQCNGQWNLPFHHIDDGGGAFLNV